MNEPSTERRLLATWTNEPFQPVRLYYAVPSRAFVVKRLRKLKCMVDVPDEGHWQWIFEAEAASLRFVRAFEHWRGNTHLTLAAIIMRAVGAEPGPRGGEHA